MEIASNNEEQVKKLGSRHLSGVMHEISRECTMCADAETNAETILKLRKISCLVVLRP